MIISPPCSSAKARTSDRPRPVPLAFWLGVAGLLEGPAQALQVLRRDADAGVGDDELQHLALAAAASPSPGRRAGVNLSALETRLSAICFSARRSALGVQRLAAAGRRAADSPAVVGLDPHQPQGRGDRVAGVEAPRGPARTARPRSSTCRARR